MIPLHQITIPHPCAADWDAMTGDAQTRFCAHCHKPVHDLTQMTTAQAQTLLDCTQLRACIRMARTADGRMVTRDAVLTRSYKGHKARGPVPKLKPRTKPPLIMLGGVPIVPSPPARTLGKIIPPAAHH